MNTVKQNNMDIELITKLLFEKYGFSLNLAELSDVIKISHQTIYRRLKEGRNIPEYKRSGNGVKSTYLFPVTAVANYIISNNVKIH